MEFYNFLAEVLINGIKTGILTNHAYVIVDLIETKNESQNEVYRTLKIRNPLGKIERIWDMSDTSLEISRKIPKELVNSREQNEEFTKLNEDGTFFISYQDWLSIYNKLYVTIDFPDSWSGLRFTDNWDETWAGGLPMPCNEKTSASWATNPQYLIQIKNHEELEFFFSLGQQDGRLIRGSTFPYADLIHPVNLIVYPSPDGQPITHFDQKWVKPELISAVVEHKEVSLRAVLKRGTYVVIPSTRAAGWYGEYFMSIYYNANLFEVDIKHLKKPEVKGNSVFFQL